MTSPKSRLEIDFERLLTKCEEEVAVKSPQLSPTEWRLERYIESLEDKLCDLQKLTACQLSRDRLGVFKKRVKFLKGLVEAEKLKSPSEKLVATQILSPHHVSLSKDKGSKSQEIFFQTQSKYNKEIRDELFSKRSGLRKRFDDVSNSDDVDLVLNYHHEMQEKIAADMIHMAQNLKENCHVANQIIRRDVEVLDTSAGHADSNFDGLKSSSEKLTEFVKRSCQYWLWISLALVSFTFLWIIVFIRLFPKRYS